MSLLAQNNDNNSPCLWIKRLAIFGSRENKKAPIRDIPFHRGLNIVWGVELPDDAGLSGAHPITLSGHSVGKTILCRLIRYCLGESTFGNSGVMSRIRHAFPKGWVGMEMVLDGQDWAVIKPIGSFGTSRSAQDISVESLFDQDHQANKYQQLINSLQDVMLSRLQTNAPPNAERPYEWKHLLAWLTRDQESRFQSLHEWRSLRSGSDTPKFQKPKEHALYLIRLVLDLVQNKEIQASKVLAEAETNLRELEALTAELRRQPEYHFSEQEEALRRLLGMPSAEALNADISDLTSPVFVRRLEIERAVSTLQRDIERLDQSITQKRIWLASYDEQRRVFRAVLEATEEATERPECQEQEDDTITKLRELRGKDCTYGDVPFIQCPYVQERLSKADKIIELQKAREDKRVGFETERRLAILDQQRKDHDQIVALLNELRHKISKDTTEKRTKEIELASYREQLQRLAYHLKESKRALDLIEGRVLNTPLQEKMTRAAKVRETIERQKQELESMHVLYNKHLKAIEAIYDALIKRALSDTYSGVIRMPKGDLQFQIEEATGLSGEAVETLALVLADVAVMMCSCHGIGHHPRFLLHDSPREADLDRHIYNRYLRVMWTLAEERGGVKEAPFQYIVTTTTRPPEGLEGAICLQLEAHPESKMLFGRVLANRTNEEQLRLFGEDGQL